MKPHIRIRLNQPLRDEPFWHWYEVIEKPILARHHFLPQIDQLFSARRIPFIATLEYQPRLQTWSREEIAAGLNRVYRLVLIESTSVPHDLVEAISLLPEVEQINAGQIGHATLPPIHSAQLSSSTDRESRDSIHLADAHAFSTGHPEVVIAVLDTGVSQNHRELRHAMLPGFDCVNIIDGTTEFIGDYLDADSDPDDEVGHGTHVSGVIAGRGVGMPEGVAPKCKILPVRVLAAMVRDGKRVGAGLVENINLGVKWAVDQGADVINMSLGIRHTTGGLPHQEVVDYARRMNVTIVAASGNDGREQLYYPGALPGVIAVGATIPDGNIAPFSTFGRQVSLVAPGHEIYSSYINDDYAFSTGTSHAAPFVSGAVALLKSYAMKHGRRFLDRHVKHILKHTADKIDQRFKHPKAGFGRLNLVDALRLAHSKLV